MTKWDLRFVGMARLIAGWSKDPSSQVGAVIVDPMHRIVSLGFNGLPRGVRDDDEVLANRDERLRRTLHAEENALLFARGSVQGCALYVTHPPCARCAAKLVQAGIVRVVAQAPAEGFMARWADDIRSSTAMFAEADVGFQCVDAR